MNRSFNELIGKAFVVCFLVAMLGAETAMGAPKNIFTRRYLGLGFDLLDRGTKIKDLYPRVDRAAKAGYNGILLRGAYYKVETNTTMQATVDKLKAFNQYCEGKGLAVVPWGLYQGEVSELDSTLSEALPVKGTPFKVTAQEARVSSDHTITINNGGFESFSGNKPNSWSIQGLAQGIELFRDTQIKRTGASSIRVESPKTTARLTQSISGLKPFRAYELSVWLKSSGYTRASKIEFRVQVGSRYLLHRRDVGFSMWGVSGNLGNFRRYTIDFNSLQHTKASLGLYLSEGPSKGTLWVDDVAIQEVGLYETMRRPTCPVIVRSEDGKTTYVEGKDYSVPHGRILCDNCTDGQRLMIPSGSRIQNGQVLSVNWFQHANVETRYATTAYCSEKAWDMQTKIVQQMNDLFNNPKGMYVFYDEWRDAGWDPGCARFPNAGEYMGYVARVTDDIIRKTACQRDVYLTQDMYDPYHNGKDPYGMTRIGTAGSWNRLPHSMIMLNWRPGGKTPEGEEKMFKSLMFYDGLDPKYPKVKNRQIISVSFGAAHAKTWDKHITDGEKQGLTGVIGMAYVTWKKNYTGIEPAADYFKSVGRWGSGPIPFGDVEQPCPVTDGIEAQKGFVSQPGPISVKTSSSGKVHYTVSQPSEIALELVDVSGRTVQLVHQGICKAGTYSVDLKKMGLSAGVYFLTVSANGKGLKTHQVALF